MDRNFLGEATEDNERHIRVGGVPGKNRIESPQSIVIERDPYSNLSHVEAA
jgi:hypothetical protein